jgi:hypothetical protein
MVHAPGMRRRGAAPAHRDGAFDGLGSTAAGARVHHERRRQTQAPWSCDRTAQTIATVQEEKKPSDMRASLAEGVAAPRVERPRRCRRAASSLAKASRATPEPRVDPDLRPGRGERVVT